MRLHRHTVDRAAQSPNSSVYHHKSRYATIFRDSGRDLSAQLETVIKKPTPEFSARFHVGGGWSETPFDGHLTILGSGFYWGLGAGWKLAERLTREKRHKYEGRDLQLSIHDGSLWLKAWVHGDSWERGEFAKWRDRSFNLNPLDRLYGRPRYWFEDIETAAIAIRMPEAVYPVVAKLQRQTFGRPKSKKRVASWTVDVDAPKGIPYRADLSGWKGDRVHGFGVTLRERREDWTVDARAAIEAYILKHRADTGFRTPEPVENQQ
ncbi:hypothetical protein IU449_27070 [Nocardia higoensis]|uniref:Uncharacterized protein n=1 Tax=Nocardia higoensis TaxID=228599 RepID=A0ABS0DI72_9NOCA|nr:hypothetical protein [Nocardia higoensis]MBF6358163.1 hypothetical protein [Nocardia higoensis]